MELVVLWVYLFIAARTKHIQPVNRPFTLNVTE